MKTKDAIILAGGLGVRLQEVIKDIPKPMAPIKDVPFLTFLFKYLKAQGIERVVLSVGYKGEVIEAYFGSEYEGIEIRYAVEEEPLGTGGGIWNALTRIGTTTTFIINGDTFFNVPLAALENYHFEQENMLSVALKPMENFSRYGNVELDGDNRIVEFNEKEQCDKGQINGGIYIVNTEDLLALGMPLKFSFETEFLNTRKGDFQFGGFVCDQYFIDIGIPEDYEKAQNELQGMIE
ncbi:nucleotidyltransferase family protein [Bacteroidales bacterium]|nr:nucleotidyltransferase family protein [Bacteroidales bacterium]